ncbi:hypothetical protein [Chitinophaga sp. CF418]|uniref:hypothetical protein n=1 Tax=Chitinophaga sp. CF418 TaxID=1855287 RepID=UPI000924456D|nr:hypothetical protein [Chitinophaga sp. CF418]SHN33218.1 hypothetical protein SAMN05216311_109152 [Chitinophaga sp. CF418]
MKKLTAILTVFFFMLLSFNSYAQTENKPDYFVGKWDVTVIGTPQGDAVMKVDLKRNEGKLTGTILTQSGSEPAAISKIEETDGSVKLYFTASGYDVFLLLQKKDDDHVTGNLLEMFDAKGVRVKAEDTKS